MVWKTSIRSLGVGIALVCILALNVSCSISYKFTGTSINYDLIKSIQLDKIANRAPYGWAPMEAMFNNKLQDLYANQTRLRIVRRGGDMQISGEITGYDQYNKAISADGFSSQVQLKLTVNIRFSNQKMNQHWERQFSATSQYNSTQQLSAVQERLVKEMIDDITEQIFNATVADW
ncbi:MAG: LptE family protein [Alloprevotella sp.]|nr:LptE family protein [Alloprevotella sp.]MBR6375141.1 LptE family protein [Alloprevotella sp.]